MVFKGTMKKNESTWIIESKGIPYREKNDCIVNGIKSLNQHLKEKYRNGDLKFSLEISDGGNFSIKVSRGPGSLK
jgi:hypothetical protein